MTDYGESYTLGIPDRQGLIQMVEVNGRKPEPGGNVDLEQIAEISRAIMVERKLLHETAASPEFVRELLRAVNDAGTAVVNLTHHEANFHRVVIGMDKGEREELLEDLGVRGDQWRLIKKMSAVYLYDSGLEFVSDNEFVIKLSDNTPLQMRRLHLVNIRVLETESAPVDVMDSIITKIRDYVLETLADPELGQRMLSCHLLDSLPEEVREDLGSPEDLDIDADEPYKVQLAAAIELCRRLGTR